MPVSLTLKIRSGQAVNAGADSSRSRLLYLEVRQLRRGFALQSNQSASIFSKLLHKRMD